MKSRLVRHAKNLGEIFYVQKKEDEEIFRLLRFCDEEALKN
jgi:hypothetical protein